MFEATVLPATCAHACALNESQADTSGRRRYLLSLYVFVTPVVLLGWVCLYHQQQCWAEPLLHSSLASQKLCATIAAYRFLQMVSNGVGLQHSILRPACTMVRRHQHLNMSLMRCRNSQGYCIFAFVVLFGFWILMLQCLTCNR